MGCAMSANTRRILEGRCLEVLANGSGLSNLKRVTRLTTSDVCVKIRCSGVNKLYLKRVNVYTIASVLRSLRAKGFIEGKRNGKGRTVWWV